MANVTYTLNIPLRTDSPSQDQENMKANTNAVDTLMLVDHYSFNNSDSLGGYHKNIHLPANNATGAMSSLASSLYTAPGVASSAASSVLFKNSAGLYLLNCIRCFGSVVTIGGNGNATPSTYYNIVSPIPVTGGGLIYTINTTSAAFTGTGIAVFVSNSTQFGYTYDYTATQLVITLSSANAGQNISFVMLQS